MRNICICGHERSEHTDRHLKGRQKFLSSICWGCLNPNPWCILPYHYFKQDNLKLVEDLAKERNLI